HFHRDHDQAMVLQKWTRFVDPARIFAIIPSTEHPSIVSDAFESLLDLTDGTLANERRSGRAVNRSLSYPEVELLRTVNREMKTNDVSPSTCRKIVNRGALSRLLKSRSPAADEPKISLPQWAFDKAVERSRYFRTAILESGVNVVGDADELVEQDRETSPMPAEGDLKIPVDAAKELAAGIISASLDRGPFFK